MTLVRWQPRNDLFWNMQREINRLFDDASSPRRSRLSDKEWVPSVDVEENDNEFMLAMDVPGVDKKDVKITVEDRILTITGERKLERSEDEGTCHCSERYYGTFSRSFSLPRAVAADQIRAAHTNGVLTVTLPKAEEARQKEIEIQVK